MVVPEMILEYLKVLIWPLVIGLGIMMLHKQLREMATQIARRAGEVTEFTVAGMTAKFESNVAKASNVSPEPPGDFSGEKQRELLLLAERLTSDPTLPPQPPIRPELRFHSSRFRREKSLMMDDAVKAKMFTVQVGDYLYATATGIYGASIGAQDTTSLLTAISRSPLAQPHWKFLVEASMMLPYNLGTDPLDKLLSLPLEDIALALDQTADLCGTAASLVKTTVEEARLATRGRGGASVT